MPQSVFPYIHVEKQKSITGDNMKKPHKITYKKYKPLSMFVLTLDILSFASINISHPSSLDNKAGNFTCKALPVSRHIDLQVLVHVPEDIVGQGLDVHGGGARGLERLEALIGTCLCVLVGQWFMAITLLLL